MRFISTKNNYSKEERQFIEESGLYGKFLNEGNYDGWINLWLDNGIQMPPNASPVRGKKEIAKAAKSFFAEYNFDMKFHSIEIIKLTEKIGIGLTLFTFSGTPKNGGDKIVFEPNGKSIAIWEKDNGHWKLQLDCYNSNIES